MGPSSSLHYTLGRGWGLRHRSAAPLELDSGPEGLGLREPAWLWGKSRREGPSTWRHPRPCPDALCALLSCSGACSLRFLAHALRLRTGEVGSWACRAHHPYLRVHGNSQGSGSGLSLLFQLQLGPSGYCVRAGGRTTQGCDLTNNHTANSLNQAVPSLFIFTLQFAECLHSLMHSNSPVCCR